MSYTEHDKFFAQAYRTGTDYWTRIPFKRRPNEIALYLPREAFVLDLGAGRGRLLYDLANLNLRAIGLEKNPELVHKGNSEINNKKLEHSLRFKEGDVLDIPFTDGSFNAVVDVGLFQHLKLEDCPQYVSEVARVVAKDGYFFLVVLSKHTENYFFWHPKDSAQNVFEKEGVRYHFFSDEEIQNLFNKDFNIKYLHYDAPHGPKDAVFAIVLLQRK